jgi:hypothetical protein
MLGLVDEGKVTMPGAGARGGLVIDRRVPAHPDPYGEDGTIVTEVRPGTGCAR